MRKFISAIGFCFLCVPLFLSNGCGSNTSIDPHILPPLIVTGAEKTVPIGDIVTLKIPPLTKYPPDLLQVHYDWRVIDPNQQNKQTFISNDGTSISFGTGRVNGKLVAVASASYLFGQKQVDNGLVQTDLKSDIAVVEINIGGDKPPDPPKPPPPPPVVIPSDKFGLTKVTYDAVDRSQGKDKVNITKGFASAYLQGSKDMVAGKYGNLNDAYQALRKANGATLTANSAAIADWTDFDSTIRKYVYQLYLDKKVTTFADYAVAWSEIAVGLNIYAERYKDAK